MGKDWIFNGPIALLTIFIIWLVVPGSKINIAGTRRAGRWVTQVAPYAWRDKAIKAGIGYPRFPMHFYGFKVKLGF